MADALQHPWFAKLHTEADLAPPPPCPFNFELCELNLDHYLLAGLDAVRAFHPEYPLKISEMLRFGIMHDRGADEVHRTRGAGGAGGAAPDGDPEAPDLLFKEQIFTLHARVRHMLRGLGTVVELMADGRTRVRLDSGEEHRCARPPRRTRRLEPVAPAPLQPAGPSHLARPPLPCRPSACITQTDPQLHPEPQLQPQP